LSQYAIAYTAYGRGGPGVALALTRDFIHFERYGLIMPPEDKDACLLPRRINGHWALIHRAVNAAGAIYRLGLALFDLDAPDHCLKRGDEWVFDPEEPYERHGDVDNVIFP